MTMISMTYGTLPTCKEFSEAFERECPDGYRIQLGTSDSRAVDGLKLGDGTLSETELWDAIKEIVSMDGDNITVSEDDELENVYQVFYPGTDREYVEIGPDENELIEWAWKFGDHSAVAESAALGEMSESRAIEALNYAAAYGSVGKCYDRKDDAMRIVSSIMATLNFEWV